MGISLLVAAQWDDKAGNSLPWWGPVSAPGPGARSAAGSGAGAEDAALERSRDPSGRVEEALTFEKRSSSPTAIYPALPALLRARRCAGLGGCTAG